MRRGKYAACSLTALVCLVIGTTSIADDSRQHPGENAADGGHGAAGSEPPLVPVKGTKVFVQRNPQTKQVKIVFFGLPGRSEGGLEFFISQNKGKAHETAIIVDALPADVNAALLLFGKVKTLPGRTVWDPENPSQVRITLKYKMDGKDKVVDGREWLVDRTTPDQRMTEDFVFKGILVKRTDENSNRALPSGQGANSSGQIVSIIDSESSPIGVMSRSTEKKDEGLRFDLRTGPGSPLPPPDTEIRVELEVVPKAR